MVNQKSGKSMTEGREHSYWTYLYCAAPPFWRLWVLVDLELVR